jgi:hypothetical protein
VLFPDETPYSWAGFVNAWNEVVDGTCSGPSSPSAQGLAYLDAPTSHNARQPKRAGL